jgi:hypothetical protein
MRRHNTHCPECRCATCTGEAGRNQDTLPEPECRCVPCTRLRWADAYDELQAAPADLAASTYGLLLTTEAHRRQEHTTAKQRAIGDAPPPRPQGWSPAIPPVDIRSA